MRLHIGSVSAKNVFDAINGQLLCNVNKFATTVVAFARVAFGVLVREL